LVLSGGGARGFAHIGVYKALVEYGVPIDRVGGTSMGAFIAAMIASQMEVDEVIDITRRIFVTKPRGFGYTLPLMSLLQVNAAEQAIKGFLKGRDIMDTWVPFFCCATNLSNSELKVFTHGPMWQALRATTAVPGLCPPVFYKGDVLVDGAVLDNVPVDIMAASQPGPIIASDVTKARAFKVDPVLETPPNTARLLWQRLTGSKEYGELPSMGAILTRSLDCSSRLRRKTNVQQASLYITPPVGDFALLEMDSIERLVEAGYEHTCRELDSTDMASILEYEFNPNEPVAMADTSDSPPDPAGKV
ncbi:MAG: patatin-like phospholipase family protein, partial [Gammaproteobacteria bacterium]|nr:patatin-like phospholipase family protein [Gammaproteobacteria bacterium]